MNTLLVGGWMAVEKNFLALVIIMKTHAFTPSIYLLYFSFSLPFQLYTLWLSEFIQNRTIIYSRLSYYMIFTENNMKIYSKLDYILVTFYVFSHLTQLILHTCRLFFLLFDNLELKWYAKSIIYMNGVRYVEEIKGRSNKKVM